MTGDSTSISGQNAQIVQETQMYEGWHFGDVSMQLSDIMGGLSMISQLRNQLLADPSNDASAVNAAFENAYSMLAADYQKVTGSTLPAGQDFSDVIGYDPSSWKNAKPIPELSSASSSSSNSSVSGVSASGGAAAASNTQSSDSLPPLWLMFLVTALAAGDQTNKVLQAWKDQVNFDVEKQNALTLASEILNGQGGPTTLTTQAIQFLEIAIYAPDAFNILSLDELTQLTNDIKSGTPLSESQKATLNYMDSQAYNNAGAANSKAFTDLFTGSKGGSFPINYFAYSSTTTGQIAYQMMFQQGSLVNDNVIAVEYLIAENPGIFVGPTGQDMSADWVGIAGTLAQGTALTPAQQQILDAAVRTTEGKGGTNLKDFTSQNFTTENYTDYYGRPQSVTRKTTDINDNLPLTNWDYTPAQLTLSSGADVTQYTDLLKASAASLTTTSQQDQLELEAASSSMTSVIQFGTNSIKSIEDVAAQVAGKVGS